MDPLIPAAQGTYSFTENHSATYTAGRDHIERALSRLLELSPQVAVDIETAGLGVSALRVKCVSIANDTHAVVADPRDPKQAAAIRRTLADAGSLIFHNSVFDVPVLIRVGLMDFSAIRGVTDTLLYARFAEPDEHVSKALGKVAERYLGAHAGSDGFAELMRTLNLSKKQGFARLDLDTSSYLQSAALDALTTARLLPRVRPAAVDRLTSSPFHSRVDGIEAAALVEREQRINRMLLPRAARGLRVDLDFADDYEHRVAAQRDELEHRITGAGIRPRNGNDLTAWLDAGGLLAEDYPRTPKTGAPSAKKGDLETLAHPMARDFVAHKELVKIKHDYLDKVHDLATDAGRVHATTSLLAAITGRASMSDPPLHQFPEAARGIVLADDGDTLTSLDWRSIEPAVVANLAGETALVGEYEAGGDLYQPLVARAGVSRKTAKTLFLGVLYGEGIAKMAGDLNVSFDEARSLRDSVFDAMPAVSEFEQKVKGMARRHRLVFSMSGRTMPISLGPGYNPGDPPSPRAYKAINYLAQGSAYDVLAETLVAIDEAGLGDAIYLTVHDEILCSSAAAEDIAAIMASAPERLCRFSEREPVLQVDRADLGTRWATA